MSDKDIMTIDVAADELDQKTLSVANDIIQEEDVTKLKDLTHLFNLLHTKKQVIRTLLYDRLLDNITALMEERVTKRADQFSNKELLDCMSMFSLSLEKAQKLINSVDETPLIQLNQQNNTVVIGSELTQDQRKRVTNAVDSILKKLNMQNLDISDNVTVYNNDSEVTDDLKDSGSEDYNDEDILLNEED